MRGEVSSAACSVRRHWVARSFVAGICAVVRPYSNRRSRRGTLVRVVPCPSSTRGTEVSLARRLAVVIGGVGCGFGCDEAGIKKRGRAYNDASSW